MRGTSRPGYEPAARVDVPSVVDLDSVSQPDRADSRPTRSTADRGTSVTDSAGSTPAGPVLPLYTPAEAARLLSVRESWLRRRATARAVPCRFMGKHLRFSHADIVAIATDAARPPGPPTRARPGARRGTTGRR